MSKVQTNKAQTAKVKAERNSDRLSIDELVALFRQTAADIAAGRSKFYRSEEEFLASLGIAGPAV